MTEFPGRPVTVAATGSGPAPLDPPDGPAGPTVGIGAVEPTSPAGCGAADAPDLGPSASQGPDTGPIAVAHEASDMRRMLRDADRAGAGACPWCGDPSPARPDLSCPMCGTRRPTARDHLEMAVGAAAAVTDRGRRRRRNEDAAALGRRATPAGELLVGVVCDGVASARRGDEASLAAVEAAVEDALDAADRDPATGELPDLDTIAAAAADAAARAAADLGRGADGVDPPACTYVGAVVRGGNAVVSWVGDSRIYWLAADESSQLLTTDDSWAEEIAAAGVVSREQAHADRRAHVLTRWLGLDAPPGPARSRRVRVAVPGLLVLCSDGLWNHVPDADELARLVRGRDAGDDAQALVDAALAAGGHDNVTVAVVPVAPTDGTDEGLEIDGRGPEEDTGPIPVPGAGPGGPA